MISDLIARDQKIKVQDSDHPTGTKVKAPACGSWNTPAVTPIECLDMAIFGRSKTKKLEAFNINIWLNPVLDSWSAITEKTKGSQAPIGQ